VEVEQRAEGSCRCASLSKGERDTARQWHDGDATARRGARRIQTSRASLVSLSVLSASTSSVAAAWVRCRAAEAASYRSEHRRRRLWRGDTSSAKLITLDRVASVRQQVSSTSARACESSFIALPASTRPSMRRSKNSHVSWKPADRSAPVSRVSSEGVITLRRADAPVIMNSSVAAYTAPSVARLLYHDRSDDVSPVGAKQEQVSEKWVLATAVPSPTLLAHQQRARSRPPAPRAGAARLLRSQGGPVLTPELSVQGLRLPEERASTRRAAPAGSALAARTR
jgi:hypothetical protein